VYPLKRHTGQIIGSVPVPPHIPQVMVPLLLHFAHFAVSLPPLHFVHVLEPLPLHLLHVGHIRPVALQAEHLTRLPKYFLSAGSPHAEHVSVVLPRPSQRMHLADPAMEEIV
jgi:hypothetical protein